MNKTLMLLAFAQATVWWVTVPQAPSSLLGVFLSSCITGLAYALGEKNVK
ncbi:hypothetical protein Barba19A_gp089 [Rheinheimera phage vB_RspM_Barba19A]|jgi:hypothetical protein|uniref:Uncharacterized protein n=2 Tax=Barbavirus barba19A TaxID=2734091 RepID=A0A4P8N7K3_9CAUD|nr:hypothetical protein HOV47_gp089 [Rheinheimera phage vB_RspM_Barba19A]QCQ61929.1 hypothetical protein Barba19A_gp089 [Rheinheimera phage vB_RspM_Barba19A]QCQ64679.1 hypothetical protein Barba31A_gp089 [Rheinheimera phage vB_RspM_Barba31A]